METYLSRRPLDVAAELCRIAERTCSAKVWSRRERKRAKSEIVAEREIVAVLLRHVRRPPLSRMSKPSA